MTCASGIPRYSAHRGKIVMIEDFAVETPMKYSVG
jgi:hypothetical protein